MPLASPTTIKSCNFLTINFTQTRSKSDTELNAKLEEPNKHLNDNENITSPSRFNLKEKFKFSKSYKFSSKIDNDDVSNQTSSFFIKNSTFSNKNFKK